MKIKLLLLLTIVFFLSGCATIGREFTFNGPNQINIGKSSQADIYRLYGKPFRVGYDNGDTMWTYGFYRYSLFGPSNTKDLVIVFDKKSVVKNYTYNSSLEEEKIRILVKDK